MLVRLLSRVADKASGRKLGGVLLLFFLGIGPLLTQSTAVDQKTVLSSLLDSLDLRHEEENFRTYANAKLRGFYGQFPETGSADVLVFAEEKYGVRHRIPAYLHHKMGIDAYLSEEYTQAIDHLLAGLDIRQEVLPPVHPATAHSWYLLGLAYYYADQNDRALQAYQNSLDIYQALGNDQMLTNCLRRLGETYNYLEEFGLAAAYFDLAIIYGNRSMLSNSLSLANLYRVAAEVEERSKEEALNYFIQAQRIFEQGGYQDQPNYFSVQINQARLLIDLGKQEAAKELLNRVLAEKNQRGDTDELDIIREYFGAINRHFRLYPQALADYQQALQFRLEVFGQHSEEVNYAYHNLGQVYQEMGDFALAAKYYQKALQAADPEFTSTDQQDNPAIEGAALTTNYADLIKDLDFKGQLFLAWYQRDQEVEKLGMALAAFERATDFMYAKRSELIGQGSKLIWQEKLFPVVEHYLSALFLATPYARFPDVEERIFQLMERSKALVLMESLAQQQLANTFPGRDSIELMVAQKMSIFAKRQRDLLEAGDNEALRIAMLEAKIDWREAQSKLIKRQATRETINLDLLLINQEATRSALTSEAQAFLHYFVGQEQVYALLLTQNHTYRHTFPLDVLPQQVTDFRLLLNEPNGDWSTFANKSYSLYQQILDPLLSQVNEPIKELIFIPDGGLSALPFEVLITRDPSDIDSFAGAQTGYLFSEYLVSYAFSASTWYEQTKGAQEAGSWAFLGIAPGFNNTEKNGNSRTCKADELPPLVENGPEVEQIKEIIGGKTKKGSKATRAAFLALAGRPRVLHLATHACVDDSEPARSRIFFSDDHLYAHELYDIPLAAEMVVLSACETGVGTFRRGEGVMSLARGFASSGAPSLTLSYWSVSDKSTAEIMAHYYRHLANGKPKHRALQAAKLDYLSTQEQTRYLHPYYWAAFVHFGDFSPLSFDPKHAFVLPTWSYFLLFSLIFILLSFVYQRFRS
jgi:CHAT domain-containing protein